MATIVTIQNTVNSGTDSFMVDGEPEGLSSMVNEAIKLNSKFVTFTRQGGLQKSVIAVEIVELLEEK